MTGAIAFQRRAGMILALLIIVLLVSLVHLSSEAGIPASRPDIVRIDLPPVPGGERMPAVAFLHDRHTETLKGDKDCSVCHLQKEDRLIFKFKRTEDGDPETDMAIYHDNCIACHQETVRSGNAAGPAAGDCRSCHNRKPSAMSSWQAIRFDKSLHYRHESSSSIRPKEMAGETNCGACHHKYDEKSEKTVYAKGEEESCRYCHKAVKTKAAQALKTASHSACINCHQQAAGASKKAGPVNCEGCHDPAAQQKIEIVKDVPRIKRNQPDWVLMAGWMNPSNQNIQPANQNIQPTNQNIQPTNQNIQPTNQNSQLAGQDNQPGKNHLDPVAFNHQAHEKASSSCVSCHHESLKKCSECHTETGDEKGGFVRLETAMHGTQTEKSCMGCHRQAQTAKNCAGCHAAIPEKKFSEASCGRCHAVDDTGIDLASMNPDAKASLAGETLRNATLQPLLPPAEQIPDSVTIKIMADEYEGATFPHRRIVQKLAAGMKDDRMARFFHQEPATLCMGCHHNSPASAQPPRCASCHGKTLKAEQSERPGLKGAYHGQCISCHRIMEIEKPLATDCTGCHKKRT